jgi:phosphoglycerate dehydrogenase-like enzyme
MHHVLYLCPLGDRQRQWRVDATAGNPNLSVTMRRNSDVARDELLRLIADADALITERSGAIDAELIAAGVRLKVIHRYGSLTHDIDIDAARARGIAVSMKPIRGTIAVAENVMLQTLALARRVMPLQRVVRTSPEAFKIGPPPHAPQRTSEDVFAFNWSGQRGVRLLQDKTIGILGFGEIGVELARRLAGWNCALLYSKRQRLPASVERELNIAYRDQDALLRDSDIVVSLLPYFPETDQWLNAARVATMRPGALLVHAGSGSVIDEAAVAAALRTGALGGASFDTFEWEPLPQDNPLLTLADADPDANVFLLPHIGSCNDVHSDLFEELYGEVMRRLV